MRKEIQSLAEQRATAEQMWMSSKAGESGDSWPGETLPISISATAHNSDFLMTMMMRTTMMMMMMMMIAAVAIVDVKPVISSYLHRVLLLLLSILCCRRADPTPSREDPRSQADGYPEAG
jgi:hypothetical protein